jgi:hypothetical protein
VRQIADSDRHSLQRAYAMVCQNPNLQDSLAVFFKVLAILLFLDVPQDVLSVYALPFLQSF